METGPAASLSNTHVPFSFSAVGVVGPRSMAQRGKKKKRKRRAIHLVVEYLDRHLREIFFPREYIPREIQEIRKNLDLEGDSMQVVARGLEMESGDLGI